MTWSSLEGVLTGSPCACTDVIERFESNVCLSGTLHSRHNYLKEGQFGLQILFLSVLSSEIRNQGKILWGSPENFRRSLGNFRGSRRGTSGEVRGKSGKSREFPEALGKSDSLPVTRQNCLQYTFPNGVTQVFGGPTGPFPLDLPLWAWPPPNTSAQTWFGPDFDPKRAISVPNQVIIGSKSGLRGGVRRGSGREG